MASPRFRCAQEVGFVPIPSGSRVEWRRVQLGQEFDFPPVMLRRRDKATGKLTDVVLPPGPWMEPVNDEAFDLVEDMVEAGARSSISADHVADMVPVKPPKAGISLSLDAPREFVPLPVVTPAERPAPRRRAKAANAES